MSEIVVKDAQFLANLDAFKSILPLAMLVPFEAIPVEMHELADDDLKRRAKTDVELERLRVAFWEEHDRATRTNTKMVLTNMISGVCTPSYFIKHISSNSYKMAYVVRPPTNIWVATNETLLYAIEEMRSILAIPNHDSKGRVNTALIKEKVNLYRELYNRVKGMTVQKVQVDQRNLNVNVNNKSAPQAASLDEIEDKIRHLEESLSVTPIEVKSDESKENP